MKKRRRAESGGRRAPRGDDRPHAMRIVREQVSRPIGKYSIAVNPAHVVERSSGTAGAYCSGVDTIEECEEA